LLNGAAGVTVFTAVIAVVGRISRYPLSIPFHAVAEHAVAAVTQAVFPMNPAVHSAKVPVTVMENEADGENVRPDAFQYTSWPDWPKV